MAFAAISCIEESREAVCIWHKGAFRCAVRESSPSMTILVTGNTDNRRGCIEDIENK